MYQHIIDKRYFDRKWLRRCKESEDIVDNSGSRENAMKRESAPDDTPSSLSSKSRNHLEKLSDIESEDPSVPGFFIF